MAAFLPLNLTQTHEYFQIIFKPWPRYVARPLIGLTVPELLIIGNKSFGIGSTLRHICSACPLALAGPLPALAPAPCMHKQEQEPQ